jgi:hypothetical protein
VRTMPVWTGPTARDGRKPKLGQNPGPVPAPSGHHRLAEQLGPWLGGDADGYSPCRPRQHGGSGGQGCRITTLSPTGEHHRGRRWLATGPDRTMVRERALAAVRATSRPGIFAETRRAGGKDAESAIRTQVTSRTRALRLATARHEATSRASAQPGDDRDAWRRRSGVAHRPEDGMRCLSQK